MLKNLGVALGEPFQFEWFVDQEGYELLEPNKNLFSVETGRVEDFKIRRKGGPLRAYRVFEDHPGLFFEFAHCEQTPEGCLRFANRYGYLGRYLGDDPGDIEYEHVDHWINAMQHARQFTAMMEFALGAKHSLGFLAPVINRPAGPNMKVRIDTTPCRKPRLQIVPHTLDGAMWLQAASVITSYSRFKKCKLCPTWYPFGAGTNNRSNKVFCSTRCRVAWNREKWKAGA